jgi:hypothetical protein
VQGTNLHGFLPPEPGSGQARETELLALYYGEC